MNNIYIVIWQEVKYFIDVLQNLLTFKIGFIALLLMLFLIYKIFSLPFLIRFEDRLKYYLQLFKKGS